MNTNNCKNTKRIPGRILLAVIAAAVLLWTLPATAGTKTIVTSWDMGVVYWLDYGEYTFPDGNMHIQGHSGISVHLSEDPGHTGLLYWLGNLQFDANGDGVFNLTWKFVACEFEYEGGEMLFSDNGMPLFNLLFGDDGMPLFTPTGSVWEGNSQSRYKGNTVTSHAVGHGVAGAADGLQVQVDSQALRSDPAVLQIITRLDPKAKK